MVEITRRDWMLFRERISLWQERYMEQLAKMMILVYLGQRSYNSRTTFPKYTDSVPELFGQRTLSQRDKLAS